MSLDVYILNVGQNDTSVIRTPGNQVVVIDAVYPDKVTDLIDNVLPPQCTEIATLIVTHPHDDHYSAVPRLLGEYAVHKLVLSPFWFYDGTPGYWDIINVAHDRDVPVQFISGYARQYPDAGEGSFPDYEDELCIELLGPPNYLLSELERSGDFNPNHLSIITRLSYGNLEMVFAGDAQMENWKHFDREGMMERPCDVLKAAHHGSKSGTQWEKLERLAPGKVFVSSDPEVGHHLPDLVGASAFLEFDRYRGSSHRAYLTKETGTVRLRKTSARANLQTHCYREASRQNISGRQARAVLDTDWSGLVRNRLGIPEQCPACGAAVP